MAKKKHDVRCYLSTSTNQDVPVKTTENSIYLIKFLNSLKVKQRPSNSIVNSKHQEQAVRKNIYFTLHQTLTVWYRLCQVHSTKSTNLCNILVFGCDLIVSGSSKSFSRAVSSMSITRSSASWH